ncbi:MAG: class 1 fructose-bisphosphatase [Thermodesulfobacteriota bacterium]|nr:class 1 fructose-bisphosphatase [Thermodesulfobacteriota bacterium]
MPKGITVTEHLLVKQRESPEAVGAFTALLAELTVAAKIIDQKVNKANLTEDLGFVDTDSGDEEHFQRLVQFAHAAIINRVRHTGHLYCMASKRETDVLPIAAKYSRGPYILVFEPLGGITDIDVNTAAGTVFSILRKESAGEMGLTADVLQPGHRQVAAGYFIYGSSTMMVYTAGNGVYGFTLEPRIGEFFLSHENIVIPEKGRVYSVNEGNYYFWDENVQNVVEYFKTPDIKTDRPYVQRYSGSLVADFHRNLLKGGIHMYPADCRDSKKPHGKLMLMCEANPLAFVAEQAGGAASTGRERILDIEPEHLHQRVPVFIGSAADVELAEQFVQGKR